MARSRWVLGENKFLSTCEARKLLRVAKAHAEQPRELLDRARVREYMIADLALSTGLRVGEIASLRCGDLFIENGMASVSVRKGKGGKPRIVVFGRDFRDHVSGYLCWKKAVGECTDADAPVVASNHRPLGMTVRGIQKAFKRCAARAGLSPHYSIHSLRHTYACHLYKASGWNLRLVQKQLGHVNIATTQVYADVMEPDLRRAVQRLYCNRHRKRKKPGDMILGSREAGTLESEPWGVDPENWNPIL